MSALGLTNTIFVPIGLGLLGFVEPCSIGSTLIMIKHLEGKNPTGKLAQIGAFAGTRAIFTGFLGMAAVVLGAAFFSFQRAAWIGLGVLYVGLGALYLTGTTGPSWFRLARSSAVWPIRGARPLSVYSSVLTSRPARRLCCSPCWAPRRLAAPPERRLLAASSRLLCLVSRSPCR